MRMYRGISVSEREFEKVCTKIRTHGIRATPSRAWMMEENDLRPRLEELFEKTDLCIDDTRPSRIVKTANGMHRCLIDAFPVVCACGDELGATYYAIHHNRTRDNDHPILITFEAELEDIHIDGRDFLYNSVFQMGHSHGQRRCALELFGSSLARYLDRAWQRIDSRCRIALCDLAVQDRAVVEQHYGNRIVIGGRYGTMFRSAFSIRLPVGPERILSITSPPEMIFKPDITVNKFKSL